MAHCMQHFTEACKTRLEALWSEARERWVVARSMMRSDPTAADFGAHCARFAPRPGPANHRRGWSCAERCAQAFKARVACRLAGQHAVELAALLAAN